MQRKIENTLLKWKESEKRKPLILIGARQTGKTYIIKKFGETHFENIIFVDFEKTERAKTIFNEDISANTIIPQLEILTNVRFISGKTSVKWRRICCRFEFSRNNFKDRNPRRDWRISGFYSHSNWKLKK